MAKLPYIIYLLYFGYSLFTLQVAAKFKCNSPYNVTSITPRPPCNTGMLPPNPQESVYEASICCKWLGQQLSVECCPLSGSTVQCDASYAVQKCECRPMPSKGNPICNKAFFYNITNPAADLQDVGKCCNVKSPKQAMCCLLGGFGDPRCPTNPAYTTAACKP